jgi:hypothetical protein
MDMILAGKRSGVIWIISGMNRFFHGSAGIKGFFLCIFSGKSIPRGL